MGQLLICRPGLAHHFSGIFPLSSGQSHPQGKTYDKCHSDKNVGKLRGSRWRVGSSPKGCVGKDAASRSPTACCQFEPWLSRKLD